MIKKHGLVLDDTRIKIAAIAAILIAAILMLIIAAYNPDTTIGIYAFAAYYVALTLIPLIWVAPLNKLGFANQCRAIGLINHSGL